MATSGIMGTCICELVMNQQYMCITVSTHCIFSTPQIQQELSISFCVKGISLRKWRHLIHGHVFCQCLNSPPVYEYFSRVHLSSTFCDCADLISGYGLTMCTVSLELNKDDELYTKGIQKRFTPDTSILFFVSSESYVQETVLIFN